MPSLRQLARNSVEAVGTAFFAGVFVGINIQVFMRYVVGRPVTWSEELPVTLLTIATLWALSLIVREADHISFDLFVDLLPAVPRRLVTAAAHAVVFVVLAIALPAIVDFAAYMAAVRSPILRLRYDFIFYFFCLFVAAVALRAAWMAAAGLAASLRRSGGAPAP